MKRRFSTKFIALSLAVLLLATAFSACGQTADATESQGGQQAGGRQSIIRMSADSTPILDPAVHAGNASSIAYCNMYDTLVFPTAEGVEPNLAEDWTVSEDGLTYTFKLKEGVKFHDGSELTASDVVFTTNRMISIGQGFAYLYSAIVQEVTADDDYTVSFRLNNAYGPFVSTLVRLYILNEDQVMENRKDGAYGEFGDYGTEWLLSNDAGSGPYKAVELVQNDYFSAEKFDDWHRGWEGKEHAPQQFRILYGTEPSTIRTMMSTQALEISDMWQSPESLTALDNIEGVDLASYSTRLMQNVFFNTTIAPTDDVNYRRALSSLIDYETMIDAAFTASKQPVGPVSLYTAGHVDTTQFTYDIEKAKEYLSQSAYADELDQHPIEFLLNTDNSALEKVALSFQSACNQVGIPVEISKGPWTTIQERVSTADSTPHVTTINSGPQFNEAGATLESQFSTRTQGTYENVSWIGNPELDAMIDDAMSTIDDQERFRKYEEIQNHVVDELCPTAWLADLTERVAYQTTYVDFPAAKATREGEFNAYLMGYPFFMPDISVYPDGVPQN